MSETNSNTPHCITNGIAVEVIVEFQAKFSIPFSDQNVFTYYIRIHNSNQYTVQLLRRHWWIWESNGTNRQVKGEGVIGEQPVLAPGKTHQYQSFCPIASSMGKMSGSYQMIRLDTNDLFEIKIPEFHLIVPEMQN